MGKVKYSKKKLIAQSATKSLKYMAPLAAGTVLSVQDIVPGSFIDRNGVEQTNDSLLCADQNGQAIKVPMREFNKMTASEGNAYEGEGDSDDIFLPNEIHVTGSEDRTFTPQGSDEPQKLYPTFAYNKADAYIASKGEMPWDELVASGLNEERSLAPVQNYSVVFK